jgi:hypothetical protein
MKNLMIGLMMALITGLVIMALMIISSRHQREKELEHALTFAVSQTLRSAVRSGKEVSAGELENRLEEGLNRRLKVAERKEKDKAFSLKVEILKADADKGILSCKAEESYSHMNGKRGRVSAEATALLETDAKETFYQVSFFLPGEDRAIRSYTLQKGSRVVRPEDPKIEGKSFSGWFDDKGRKLTDESRVDENLNYLAHF